MEEFLDGEGSVLELAERLATGNDDMTGEAGEGLLDSCNCLRNTITQWQVHFSSFCYLVRETHRVEEKLLGSKVGCLSCLSLEERWWL